jgi:hypothetical protein
MNFYLKHLAEDIFSNNYFKIEIWFQKVKLKIEKPEIIKNTSVSWY